jgi:hypothetical protein
MYATLHGCTLSHETVSAGVSVFSFVYVSLLVDYEDLFPMECIPFLRCCKTWKKLYVDGEWLVFIMVHIF